MSLAANFQALAPADFAGSSGTPDGDLDLYLGRAASTESFFYQNARLGSDAPSHKWLKVKIASDDRPNNRGGIGCVVQVSTTLPGSLELVQTQVVDGGSGVGSQAAHELVFGLADAAGDVEVEVRWPDGSVQNVDTVPNGALPTTITVQDDHTVGLVTGSVGAYVIGASGGSYNWVFEWKTLRLTDPALDSVTITGGSSPCPTTGVTLTPGSNDVTHQVFPVTGGGYLHRLVWHDRTCAIGCQYSYTVSSSVLASQSPETHQKTLKISTCIN